MASRPSCVAPCLRSPCWHFSPATVLVAALRRRHDQTKPTPTTVGDRYLTDTGSAGAESDLD